MISVPVLLYLLFAHWVGDFLCQTTEMGTMKSKDNSILVRHTLTYSLVMFAFLIPVIWVSMGGVFIFCLVTFICHTIQDYITSRITSRKFAEKQYNGLTGAFTVIGLDQFLHYLQIFITYLLVT